MEFDYDHIKPARVNGAHSATLVSIDRKKRTAVFLSSDKVTHYHTSLKKCECTYFVSKYDLCKHMVRLAMELGVVNSEGRTPRAQFEYDYERLRNQIALAYGYAKYFEEPIMSEKAFESAVNEYRKLLAHKHEFD